MSTSACFETLAVGAVLFRLKSPVQPLDIPIFFLVPLPVKLHQLIVSLELADTVVTMEEDAHVSDDILPALCSRGNRR